LCLGGTFLLLFPRAEAGSIAIETTTATSLGGKVSDAQEALAAAEALRAQWTAASLRQAIEKYEQASLDWIALTDLSYASSATLQAGDVYFLLNEYPQALKSYQKAEALARKTHDRVAQATALSQLGRLYSYMGKNDLAQAYLARALNFFERNEGSATPVARKAHANALSNLGEVIYAKGNLPKARNQFERARKYFDGDQKGEAKVHLFAAYIAGTIGEPDKAVAEISQALNLYRGINDKSGEGLALTALGLSYSFKRDEKQAIELHQQAIEIFRAIGDRYSEAIALIALGQVWENSGEYGIALNNYEAALRLSQDISATDLIVGATLKSGKAHRLSGHFDQALAYLERCLSLSRAAKKVRMEANALSEIAMVYATQNRDEQTSQQYRRLERFYESIGDRRGKAIALNLHGDYLLRAGRKEQALDTYRRALSLSEKVGDKGILITTLYNLARAYHDLGNHEVALSVIQQSLKIIEELRTNLGSPEVRASYFSGVQKHYELCIDILMQLDLLYPGKGFGATALSINEKSRARSLLDLLGESHTDLRNGATAQLLDREHELNGLLRSLAKYDMDLSLNKKDSAERAEVTRQMAKLRSEYQEIQAQLREHQSHLSLLERFEPIGLEQIQNQLLDTNTLLLQYALGAERSYLFAVTPNSFHAYPLPPRKVIEDAASEIYKLFISRQGSDGQSDKDYQANVEAADKLLSEKASSLSQMLLGPVAQQLPGKKLLLVTEGMLQYVPFEALPVPGAQEPAPGTQRSPLLIETNEVAGTPSISTLAAIRAEKSQAGSPDRLVAVIADPVFSRNDERLRNEAPSGAIVSGATDQKSPESAQPPLRDLRRDSAPVRLTHSSEEAEAILAAAPRGTTMMVRGFDATCETVMSSDVRKYQILHFATHGFLDTEHPELSGIVLTMVDRSGAEKNGLMPLHDIYNLDLSAELTVLSACQTALGKDIKGEGMVGLTHSFISAGSKSVVASLWKVDDRATSILMADFYDSMLRQGMPTGAALRSAKLKMMQDKRWSAPYFWAGFVLQGEYTNRIVVQRNSWLAPGPVLLLLVLISSGVIVFQRRRRRSSPA
jgi:CHAT domain-containing protein/predicted negative regulator of RcsB-dependent stress response